MRCRRLTIAVAADHDSLVLNVAGDDRHRVPDGDDASVNMVDQLDLLLARLARQVERILGASTGDLLEQLGEGGLAS